MFGGGGLLEMGEEGMLREWIEGEKTMGGEGG